MNKNVAFEQFVAELKQHGIETNDVSLQEQNAIAMTYQSTIEFLVDNNLVPGEQLRAETTAMEALNKPITQMNDAITLAEIGPESINALVQRVGVPDHMRAAACKDIAFIISNESIRDYGTHMANDNTELTGVVTANQYLGPIAMSNVNANVKYASEAFGADMDKLHTDVRLNITISLMRFQKNLIDRLINRKASPSNVVQFIVPYAEVYDLEKAGNDASSVREGSHKVPMIDLHKTPSKAGGQLKTIEVLKSNDSDGVLTADDRIIFGKSVNLFDLALDSSKIGYDHIDRSDLVSEGAMMDTIYMQAFLYVDGAGGDITEIVPINVKGRSGSRFTMQNNGKDSADRVCLVQEDFFVDDATLKLEGTAATALAAITGDAQIKLNLNVSGFLNLKTSAAHATGSVEAELVTESGEAAEGSASDAFDNLTFTLIDYKLAAKYSEENMRKTTTAVTASTRPMSYEIPTGASTVVDYSLQQNRPADILDIVTQAIMIQSDYKHITNILEIMDQVYDRNQAESDLGSIFQSIQRRINYDFAAGMKVNPIVLKQTMDIDTIVTTVESGRSLGDVRTAVEKYLIEIFAKLYSDSLYQNALPAGEAPRFRVLTSGPLKDAILNVPHYHDHLNRNSKLTDNNETEFTYVLPNGTILEIFTTNWDTFTDQILIIPFRTNDPESELNFGQNADRGTFVANFAPTTNNATIRRIATNTRESVIPTNPVAIRLTVSNVSAVFSGMGSL